MTVILSPQIEVRLQALAERRGQARETVIETALDALQQMEDAPPPEPPSADEAEQARLRRVMAQARALKPEPRTDDPDIASEEAALGEILVAKFRRQGFQL